MKIAIDGPAAAGKTTLAKNLAEKLDFWYIDTGALFRAISVYLLRNGIIKDNRSQIIYLTKAPDLFENKITIRWTPSGKMNILIDGRKVSDKELRSPEVSMMASDIGVIPEVREMVLRKERALAYIGDIIMEGRDTTTVVLPDADLKIYLTADIGTRVTRRVNQLQQKSNEPVSYEMIRKQLLTRDYQDMNREYAPLKIADDAILVDSTGETAESILRHVSGLIEKYRKENMGE